MRSMPMPLEIRRTVKLAAGPVPFCRRMTTPLKGLDPFPLTLADAEIHLYGVSRPEPWNSGIGDRFRQLGGVHFFSLM